MRTVAFITYNQIGRGGITSGWHERDGHRALVLQNTKGEGSRDGGQPIGEKKRVEQTQLLFNELRKELNNVDHLVVYVGTNGSEGAIRLASEVSADKVTFVACDCGLLVKELMIQKAGLVDAGRVLCECGGHLTMERLYQSFIATGALDPRAH